jgi:hypothetical protein
MNVITNEELYRYYKNICHTRLVSFQEFKENYIKSVPKEIGIIIQMRDLEDAMKENEAKWPTLAGRLNHPLKTRYEGLKQMKENGDILSEESLKG